jgi:hypothetical protein
LPPALRTLPARKKGNVEALVLPLLLVLARYTAVYLPGVVCRTSADAEGGDLPASLDPLAITPSTGPQTALAGVPGCADGVSWPRISFEAAERQLKKKAL